MSDIGLPRPVREGKPWPWISGDLAEAEDRNHHQGHVNSVRRSLAQRDMNCQVCGIECGLDAVAVIDRRSVNPSERERVGQDCWYVLDSVPLHLPCVKIAFAHCPHLRDNVKRYAVVKVERANLAESRDSDHDLYSLGWDSADEIDPLHRAKATT